MFPKGKIHVPYTGKPCPVCRIKCQVNRNILLKLITGIVTLILSQVIFAEDPDLCDFVEKKHIKTQIVKISWNVPPVYIVSQLYNIYK